MKKNTHGGSEYRFGYKLHLLVNCESELPIAANVTPGNIHDSRLATDLMSEARFTTGPFNPPYLMADKAIPARS